MKVVDQRHRRPGRIAIVVGVPMLLIGAVALLIVREVRVPSHGAGDHWRVLGRSPTWPVEVRDLQAFRVAEPAAWLTDGDRSIDHDEAAVAVLVFGRDCQYVRVSDVEFEPHVLAVSSRRYSGTRDCTDAVSTSHLLVLAITADRLDALTHVSVDGAPPSPIGATR